MRGLQGLLDLITFLMIAFPEESLHIFAEDYERAFEQLALHPDEWPHCYFHVLIDGLAQFFMHTSGFFGSRAMPATWCRIGTFINAVLALRFGIMSVIHMDDRWV